MEFPELGKHCCESTCNKLDFLPVKCDACSKIFCSEHMNYEKHGCPNVQQKDVQVPICPLCESPVPTPRNQRPDIAVSNHIDKDCRIDPGKKINLNKCSMRGCKIREMIPVICSQCKKNFCLQHRFPDIHRCESNKKNRPGEAASQRQQESQSSQINAIQGSMSEDEALARALSESMREADRIMSRNQRNQRSDVNGSVNPQRCHVF